MAKRATPTGRRAYFSKTDGSEFGVSGLRHIGWDLFPGAMSGRLGPHHHGPAYELCLIRHGSVNWWVGDEQVTVSPGQLYLTRPRELHGAQRAVMDPCELYWIGFVLDRRRGSLGLSPREARSLDDGFATMKSRVAPASGDMADHYEGILAAIEAGDVRAAARIRSHLLLLLEAAILAYASAAEPDCSPRIAAAREWLAANAHDPSCSIAEAAARTGLAASRFRSVFAAETGFSPQEYLLRQRIDRAKRMLSETDAPIIEIALSSGFNSSQYFATAFKRAVGVTPRAWRAQ